MMASILAWDRVRRKTNEGTGAYYPLKAASTAWSDRLLVATLHKATLTSS